MTFDLYLWPLTSWTCDSSYIISINQVWFQLDYNFSNWVNFTFQPTLTFERRWPLTLICDIWPHQQMQVLMLYLWLNFGWNQSKHVKLESLSQFQPILKLELVTFDCINKCGFPIRTKFDWSPWRHVEVKSQMLTSFHNNTQTTKGTKWSLLHVFPAKAGNTTITATSTII